MYLKTYISLVALFSCIYVCLSQSYVSTGPRSLDASIGIIGGGVEGIRMARLLKMNNFTDVTVYEASHYIGNEFWSISHRGIEFHYLASIPNNGDTEILTLANQYLEPADLIGELLPTIWSKNQDGEAMQYSIPRYLIEFTMKTYDYSMDAEGAMNKLMSDMQRYKDIRSQFLILGSDTTYQEIPWPMRFEVGGTISHFLASQEMMSLKPIFILQMTLLGLGHPDEIAALQGLIKVTPEILDSYEILLKMSEEELLDYRVSITLRNGYTSLFQKIIDQYSINLMRDTTVYRIDRMLNNSQVTSRIHKLQTSGLSEEDKDFIISGLNPLSFLKALDFGLKKDYTQSEYQLFLQAKKSSYRHHSLIDVTNITRGNSPIHIFIDELMNMGGGVALLYDTYAVMNQVTQQDYINGDYEKNADSSEYVTYQALHYTYGEYDEINYDNLMMLSVEGLKIVNVRKHTTGYNYDAASILDGIGWDLERIQNEPTGTWQNNDWYRETQPVRTDKFNEKLVESAVSEIERQASSPTPTPSSPSPSSSMRTSFATSMAPSMTLGTPLMSSILSMDMTPKLSMTSSMDMATPVSMTPSMDMTSSVSMTSSMDMATPVSMTPSMDMSPKISITSSMDMATPVSMTPSMDMTSSVSMTSSMDMTTPVSMTSSMDMATPVSLTSSMDMSPKVSITSSMDMATPVSMTPSMDMTSSVSMTSSMDMTTPVSMTSSMDMATPVSMTQSMNMTLSVSMTSSMDMATPVSMTSSMDMTSKESMTSSVDMTTPVSMTPSMDMSPKVSITSSMDMATPISMTSSMDMATPFSMTPSMDMTSSVSMTSSMEMATPVSMTSSVDITSKDSMTSSMDMTTPDSMMPSMGMTSKVSMTSSVDMATPVSMTSSMDMTTKDSMTSSMDMTIKDSITSSMDMATPVSMTSAMDMTPKLSMTSSMDMATPVSMTSSMTMTTKDSMMSSMDMTTKDSMTPSMDMATPVSMTSSMDLTTKDSMTSSMDVSSDSSTDVMTSTEDSKMEESMISPSMSMMSYNTEMMTPTMSMKMDGSMSSVSSHSHEYMEVSATTHMESMATEESTEPS